MKLTDDVILFTDLDVAECQRRLSAELEEKRWRPWRLWASGYGGSKEMLGWARGKSFSFRPRKYARNWLAPTCYGRIYPQDGRTRIDAYFERPPMSGTDADRFFELAMYALVLVPMLFASLSGDSRGTWLELILFATLVVYLIWYIRRALYQAKPAILEFLQKTLVARIEPRP